MILASRAAASAPLADSLVGDTVAPGPHAGASVRAGGLGTQGWGCAGVEMDGEHQRSLQPAWRRTQSDGQA